MNILEYMGNTPIIELKNIYNQNYGRVWVKLEEFNPGGSIKSRVGLKMISDAEKAGLLSNGSRLIEPTGGNTGMGLALASAIKGYKLTLVIPDNFSEEKVNTLKKYGVDILRSDHRTGPGSHIRMVHNILKEDNQYIFLDQFTNTSNPKTHYLFTGEEIIVQMKNKISAFICGVGSGGTIAGVGRRLKELNTEIKVIGVQPKGCDIKNGVFIPHKIEAIAVGIIPPFIDFNQIDHFIDVDIDEVQELRDYLTRKESIFIGISAGANILAAMKLSRQYKNTENIVTVAPDSGRSYI
ncbi:cysteine synthase family protein [Salmonella enterica]|nr:cysteine synthase family protein [Salmonella enterica]EIP1620859.1 cysteine synthase family protein [Salmonella enterica]